MEFLDVALDPNNLGILSSKGLSKVSVRFIKFINEMYIAAGPGYTNRYTTWCNMGFYMKGRTLFSIQYGVRSRFMSQYYSPYVSIACY